MILHQGKTLERVLRRSGCSLSEVARLTKVNRRSVYNWFNQARLKPDIIHRIGWAIKHDFSVEFPDLFIPQDFTSECQRFTIPDNVSFLETDEETDMWKNKYIELMERYNDLLSKKIAMQI